MTISAVPSAVRALAMLQGRGLHKSFGGRPVLKDVSLALESGTVSALADENRAGMSTMRITSARSLNRKTSVCKLTGARCRAIAAVKDLDGR